MNPSTGLRLALGQAWEAEHSLWKLGAALTRGGSLLTVGRNKTKNDPLIVDHKFCSVHAEEDVLNQVDDATGTVLYVARVTRGRKIGLARPCVRCMETAHVAGVRKVVYTVDAHQFGVIRVGAYMEGDYDAEEICRLSARHVKCINYSRIKANGRNSRTKLYS